MLRLYGIAGLALALTALPAAAAEPTDYGMSIYGGVGVLWLEGNEYVYQSSTSDDRLSQLIWQSTAPVLTAGFDVKMPQGWTLALKGQVGMSGDSYMEDYDWIAPYATGTGDDDWSDRSQHEDTNLDWYFNGSILLGHDFAVSDNVTMNVNAGFKYTDVKWSAHGGNYIYSVGGYRNTVGSFADGLLVGDYRQQIPALVAGLDLNWEHDGWTVDLGAQGGVTFGAKTKDNHFLRDLIITDEVNSAPLLAVSGQAAYALTQDMSVFVGGTVEQIFTGRADAHYDNTGVINDFDYLSGQGASLFAATLTAGVKGTF